jgi:hypothetical protein
LDAAMLKQIVVEVIVALIVAASIYLIGQIFAPEFQSFEPKVHFALNLEFDENHTVHPRV